MKKLFLLLVLSVSITFVNRSYAQYFVEDFDYTVGDSLGAHGWDWHSGATTTLLVTAGNLTYQNYSDGIGNSTTIFGGAGSREDSHKLFNPVDTNATSYYAAFLVNVSAAAATGDYFLHFGTNPHTTNFRGRVFVKSDGLGGFFFGLSKASTSTVSYTTTSYVFGNTYLLVLKYSYQNNTNNDDIVSLFINPDPAQPEPGVADLTSTDIGTDIILGALDLRQGSNAYTVQVDGIKFNNSWTQLVPVELTSFAASVNGNSVSLKWATATETNNSGFEVERKSSSTGWQKIAFVQGNGTTTQPKSYSYSDRNLADGKYSYRLKQIDLDGTFDYSKVVEVNINSNTVNQFELAQNYPNPFNPTTAIKFNLPEGGNVKLSVYNLLGQEVATLVNGFKEAGSHTVNFDASNLNSGIYLYKIQANGFTQTRKMTLIK